MLYWSVVVTSVITSRVIIVTFAVVATSICNPNSVSENACMMEALVLSTVFLLVSYQSLQNDWLIDVSVRTGTRWKHIIHIHPHPHTQPQPHISHIRSGPKGHVYYTVWCTVRLFLTICTDMYSVMQVYTCALWWLWSWRLIWNSKILCLKFWLGACYMSSVFMWL